MTLVIYRIMHGIHWSLPIIHFEKSDLCSATHINMYSALRRHLLWLYAVFDQLASEHLIICTAWAFWFMSEMWEGIPLWTTLFSLSHSLEGYLLLSFLFSPYATLFHTPHTISCISCPLFHPSTSHVHTHLSLIIYEELRPTLVYKSSNHSGSFV